MWSKASPREQRRTGEKRRGEARLILTTSPFSLAAKERRARWLTPSDLFQPIFPIGSHFCSPPSPPLRLRGAHCQDHCHWAHKRRILATSTQTSCYGALSNCCPLWYLCFSSSQCRSLPRSVASPLFCARHGPRRVLFRFESCNWKLSWILPGGRGDVVGS